MGNICNGNGEKHKKKANSKSVNLQTLFNYYPKFYVFYIGSRNNTFIWGEEARWRDWINAIIISNQFSLGNQVKMLKKWCVNFNKVGFFKKSNQLIAISDQEVEKWEIDISCDLSKNFETIFKYPEESVNYIGTLMCNRQQLQLSKNEDWIAVSQNNFIFLLQKEIDKEWNCFQKMNIPLLKTFIVNEEGNILLITQFKDNQQIGIEFTVYMRNNIKEWTIIKKIDADNQDNICFWITNNLLQSIEFLIQQRYGKYYHENQRLNCYKIQNQDFKAVKKYKAQLF